MQSAVIINMSVNVFGHKLNDTRGRRGPPGVGYNLTYDGQFDIGYRRLCNVAGPEHPNDVVIFSTLHETEKIFTEQMVKLNLQLKAYKAKIEKMEVDIQGLKLSLGFTNERNAT